MRITRYSAAEQFGIPIYGRDPGHATYAGLLDLAHRYDLPGEEVPADIVDITPRYLEKAVYTYMMTRKDPRGPVAIDMMPRSEPGEVYKVLGDADRMLGVQVMKRTFVIPTDTPAFVLTALSPRFGPVPCIHEIVALEPPA